MRRLIVLIILLLLTTSSVITAQQFEDSIPPFRLLTWSPDGRTLAFARKDRLFAVEAATGALVLDGRIEQRAGWSSVNISIVTWLDDAHLVTRDVLATRWTLETGEGQTSQTLLANTIFGSEGTYSRANGVIVFASFEGSEMWLPFNDLIYGSMNMGAGSVSFNHAGDLLAYIPGGPADVRVTNWANLSRGGPLEYAQRFVHPAWDYRMNTPLRVRWSPDEQVLMVVALKHARQRYNITRWRVADGALLGTLTDLPLLYTENFPGYVVVPFMDDAHLLTVAWGGQATLYDAATLVPLAQAQLPPDTVAAAWSPLGVRLALFRANAVLPTQVQVVVPFREAARLDAVLARCGTADNTALRDALLAGDAAALDGAGLGVLCAEELGAFARARTGQPAR